jgi:hypothetical protein
MEHLAVRMRAASAGYPHERNLRDPVRAALPYPLMATSAPANHCNVVSPLVGLLSRVAFTRAAPPHYKPN